MLRFLIHSHFEKMAAWFLLLPVGAMLLVSPFLLFSDNQFVFLYALVTANALVLALFLDQTLPYQSMLHTMPLARSTFVQTKFSFSYLIIAYQLILFGITQSNRSLYDALSLLILIGVLCIIATNLVLLYHFYTGQQKSTLTIAILFYWPLLLGFQQIEPFIVSKITLTTSLFLMLFIIVITQANKRLCLHFSNIKDTY